MVKKLQSYWSLEKCLNAASSCKTRKQFRTLYPGAYNSVIKNKWIDIINTNLSPSGHKYKRMVYAYEFPDNSVYVGLTCDIERRQSDHKIRGSVHEHVVYTNQQPCLKIISDYIDVSLSQELEYQTVNLYKEAGWKILNKKRTGGLGGCDLKWSKEQCFIETRKFSTINDFKKNNPSAYNVIRKNGWFDLYSHMIRPKNHKFKWSKERCKEKAILFTTKKELKEKFPGAMSAAYKNKWVEYVCSHMK
jgi:predicted GIY-YIG superfamily endonuclease